MRGPALPKLPSKLDAAAPALTHSATQRARRAPPERGEALVDVARLLKVLALRAAAAVRAAADALAAREVDQVQAAEHHLGQLALDLGEWGK